MMPTVLPDSQNLSTLPFLTTYLSSLQTDTSLLGYRCCSVTKLFPTLCYPRDCSLPVSSVHGISQSRILVWVAISFSRGSIPTQRSNPRLLHWQADSLPLSHQGSPHSRMLLLLLSRFSRVWLCATPQTAAHQAPLSLGFSRQEHWSGLPFPSPVHESEKWKWSHSVVSDSSWPNGLQPPDSSIHGIFQAKEYWSGVPLPSLRKINKSTLQRFWWREEEDSNH